MEKIETFKYKNLTIDIVRDEDAESPDSWENENGVLIVTTRNRYFDVTPKGWNASELDKILDGRKMYEKDGTRYHVRRLYMYQHSCTALSLTDFNDRWDSGTVGAVLIKTGVVGRGAKHGVNACAQGHVDTWNMYLSSDVYGYIVRDAEENELDSCWGIYGITDVREEALSQAKYYGKA